MGIERYVDSRYMLVACAHEALRVGPNEVDAGRWNEPEPARRERMLLKCCAVGDAEVVHLLPKRVDWRVFWAFYRDTSSRIGWNQQSNTTS